MAGRGGDPADVAALDRKCNEKRLMQSFAVLDQSFLLVKHAKTRQCTDPSSRWIRTLHFYFPLALS